MRSLGLATITPFFLIPSLFALAAPVQAPHTALELVAETVSAEPGKELNAGLLFALDPGWHIYWINPGDSGEPPRVVWNLAPGLHAGRLEWPAPERLPSGPLTDYGYAGRVLLISPIEVPQRVSGDKTTLSADVRWLVCRDVCMPARATVSLALPVRRATPRRNPVYAPLFRATKKSLPRPLPPGWRAVAADQGTTFRIRVRGSPRIERATFFPLDPNQVENAKPQVLKALPDGMELEIQKPDQLIKPIRQLRGVIVIDGTRSYRITAPVIQANSVRKGG